MSADLQWLLLRNHNSYMVKRVREGPVFSKEPGNLRNLHSYKYSGLANDKTIDVNHVDSGLQITTRKVSDSKTRVVSTIRHRSGPRRSLGIAAHLAKRRYRPDLRPALLARVSALLKAQKTPKPERTKKLRGKKAKETADSS